MARLDVSVIIVNYNGGAYLRRCLHALSQQTKPPVSVILVDNASNDGSCDGLETEFPDVRLLRQSTNLGFAAANNLAAKLADNTTWLALLNPDAFPEADWLERLMETAQRHPDVAAFGSQALLADHPDLIDGIGDVYHISGLAWRREHNRPASKVAKTMREIFSPCAAAALYRSDRFREVGGFDEAYFCYFEDVDLGFRLRLAGYACLYVPEARVLHQGSASTGRRSDFAVYHGYRNLIWTYAKNMPPLLFWGFLPLHVLLNLTSFLLLSFRGQAGVAWRALWDGWRGMLHMRDKRTGSHLSNRTLLKAMDTRLFSPFFRDRGKLIDAVAKEK